MVSELSGQEFGVIRKYFHNIGSGGAYLLMDVWHAMVMSQDPKSRNVLEALIKKKVLDCSPDGLKVKFTDYGLELIGSKFSAQKNWDKQKFIKISNINRDEILIRFGETFKANRILREIFSEAKNELCILDPYIGAVLFDLIEDTNPNIKLRIITSDRSKNSAFTAYKSYRSQYANVEMRVSTYDETKFHDRFILWDNWRGFHLGHSIKDLGNKDAQLNLINNPADHMALFEERWRDSNSVK